MSTKLTAAIFTTIGLAALSASAVAGPGAPPPPPVAMPSGSGPVATPVGPTATPVQWAQVSGTCERSDRIPNTQWTTCATPRDAIFTFRSDGEPTMYGLKITAPSAHCSAVNYQVWSTSGPEHMYARTQEFLNAGESELVQIGNEFPRGNVAVAIRVLGQVGGCNTGAMQGWGARVELVVIP
jgi:hypothetical protein